MVDYCEKIDDSGGKFLLSNSSCNRTQEAFLRKGWYIETVLMRRNINKDGKKRKPVKEILVRNYQ